MEPKCIGGRRLSAKGRILKSNQDYQNWNMHQNVHIILQLTTTICSQWKWFLAWSTVDFLVQNQRLPVNLWRQHIGSRLWSYFFFFFCQMVGNCTLIQCRKAMHKSSLLKPNYMDSVFMLLLYTIPLVQTTGWLASSCLD